MPYNPETGTIEADIIIRTREEYLTTPIPVGKIFQLPWEVLEELGITRNDPMDHRMHLLEEEEIRAALEDDYIPEPDDV